jgi:hypothetical protein
MRPIHPQTSARGGNFRLGFKTSIIALFVAIVLIIGLTLVYFSFSRIASITDSAASKFIGEVAELSADRIGSQLKLVRDDLAVLGAMPPVQSADIEDNPQLNALLAAMLRTNGQLFNLYVGYDDGSFIEMDAIDARDDKRAHGSRRQNGLPFAWSSYRDPTRPGSNQDGCFCLKNWKRSGNCQVPSTMIRASAPGTRTPIAATGPG